MRGKAILVGVISLCLVVVPAFGWTQFNDGEHHIIGYSIDGYSTVDYGSPGVGTHIEVVSGGWFTEYLDVYEDGVVTINGGKIGSDYVNRGDGLSARNRSYINMISGEVLAIWSSGVSTLDISGGNVPYGVSSWENSQINIFGTINIAELQVSQESRANMSGGTINKWVTITDYGEMTVAGGNFGYGFLIGYYDAIDYGHIDHALLKLAGTNFKVNGQPVQYGQSARTYATPYNFYGYPCLRAYTTGTLGSGQYFSENCYIFTDSDIIFIPEPATLLLLGLGAVILRKFPRRAE